MRVAPLLFVLPFVAPAAASGQEAPEVLEPVSKWVLDYGESRCRIARTFAAETGGEESLVYFEQHAPDASFTWLIAGPILPRRSAVTVQFGPDNAPFEVGDNTLKFGEYGRAISARYFARQAVPGDLGDTFQEVTGPNGVDDGKTVAWIDIAPGTGQAVRIPVDEMPAIEDAMKTCMDDLMRSWGVDPLQQAKVAERPKWTNLADVAQRIHRKYPSAALRRGEQGTIQLRLMIEADGTPSKCVRTNLNQADNIDNSACLEIMRSGVFEPALDAEGRPIRSYLMQLIRYAMR